MDFSAPLAQPPNPDYTDFPPELPTLPPLTANCNLEEDLFSLQLVLDCSTYELCAAHFTASTFAAFLPRALRVDCHDGQVAFRGMETVDVLQALPQPGINHDAVIEAVTQLREQKTDMWQPSSIAMQRTANQKGYDRVRRRKATNPDAFYARKRGCDARYRERKRQACGQSEC